MAEDELVQLLGEQIAYYRARAIEYDRTAPFTDHHGYPELSAALERFAPRGRVLELACGTGQWTKELAEYATELTAVDASEEMLALNRAHVARTNVVYVQPTSSRGLLRNATTSGSSPPACRTGRMAVFLYHGETGQRGQLNQRRRSHVVAVARTCR
jgi:SAM-dependent methyltransferase